MHAALVAEARVTAGVAGGSGTPWLRTAAAKPELIGLLEKLVGDLEAIKRANAAFETLLANMVGEMRALSESTLQDHLCAITGNAAVITAMHSPETLFTAEEGVICALETDAKSSRGASYRGQEGCRSRGRRSTGAARLLSRAHQVRGLGVRGLEDLMTLVRRASKKGFCGF